MLSNSAAETRAIGERIAARLRSGDVVLLQGDLGAGKSELARGIARGLAAEAVRGGVIGEIGLRLDDDPITLLNPGIALRSTDATRYGVGVVQEIDAAAMSLWAKWRHHELDGTLANGEKFSADDVDMFLAGAVIFY